MNDQWLKRWEEGRISFHEGKPNDLLTKHFSSFNLKPSRCLVPLCGKAVDMRWIREQGHEVTGVELSEIAIRDFFRENFQMSLTDAASNTAPRDTHLPMFTYTPAPSLRMILGNFFDYKPAHAYDWIYDRAALIALPPQQRPQYIDFQKNHLKPGGAIILLTVDYDTALMEGPPFAISEQNVKAYYGDAQSLEKIAECEPQESVAHLKDKLTWIKESLWEIRF